MNETSHRLSRYYRMILESHYGVLIIKVGDYQRGYIETQVQQGSDDDVKTSYGYHGDGFKFYRPLISAACWRSFVHFKLMSCQNIFDL